MSMERWQASISKTDERMARRIRRNGRLQDPRERRSARREMLASTLEVDRLLVLVIRGIGCIRRVHLSRDMFVTQTKSTSPALISKDL